MTTPNAPKNQAPVAIPPSAPGIGAAFSATMQTVVTSALAMNAIAQTVNNLATIAEVKSSNMLTTVQIEDAMVVAALRHKQKQQLEALNANGIEVNPHF